MFTHAQKVLYQIFLCQNVPKEILFTGTKFHAKPSRGSRVICKKPVGGVGCTPPPKKNSRRVNKTLDARYALQVFKYFKFLFMHSWMFCAPHLVPDIEYFARINHIMFNWKRKFGNKFPGDCLKIIP